MIRGRECLLNCEFPSDIPYPNPPYQHTP